MVNCLLIAVPNFDLQHSCVLVNLNQLDCHEIAFTSSLSSSHVNPDLERLLSEEKNRETADEGDEKVEEDEGNALMQNLMGDSDDDMDM